MAKLVDAPGLGPGALTGVGVRIPLPAPNSTKSKKIGIRYRGELHMKVAHFLRSLILGLTILLVPLLSFEPDFRPTTAGLEAKLVNHILNVYPHRSPEEVAQAVNFAFLYHPDWLKITQLLAIIQVESNFNAKAINRFGPSVGLMQINQHSHRVTHWQNPEANILAGVDVLENYRSPSGFHATLLNYNFGPARAKSFCKGKQVCTTDYVRKVEAAEKELHVALERKE